MSLQPVETTDLSIVADAVHAVNPWVALAYLAAGVLFILALRGLSSPATSQRGNRFGMAGMLIAVVTTLVTHEIASLVEILGAIAVGGAIVALREAFPYPDLRTAELEGKALPIARQGAAQALLMAFDPFDSDLGEHGELLAAGRRRAQEWVQRDI